MSLRILQMNIDNKNMGGAYVLVKNLEPYLREEGIVFDYLTMDEFSNNTTGAFKVLSDSKIFSAHLRKNKIMGHILLPFYVYKTLKNNTYNIIHINSDSSWKAYLYAMPAKKAGVRTIIVHSHSIGMDGNFQKAKKFLHKFFVCILDKYISVSIACSKEAADWMFIGKNRKYCKILFNGINIKEYQFNPEKRIEERKKLNIQDKLVIGNVGMLSKTKNQIFLLKILSEIRKSTDNVVLLLVGKYDAKWKKIINNMTSKLKIRDSVILYGTSNNVKDLLNAMDIFVLPSKFEGFSLALVEAQANGLPCLISDTIPSISTVSSIVSRMSLMEESSNWAEMCMNIVKQLSGNRKNNVVDRKYDISESGKELAKLYYSF